MARRKITTKTRRKDDLDPNNDEFINKTVSILDWLYDRRRPLIFGSLAAFAVSVLFIVATGMIQSSKEKSSSIMAEGLSAAMAPVIPPKDDGGAPQVPDDEDFLYFEDGQARATEALRRFEKAVEAEGDSLAGTVGELGASVARVQIGEKEKALKGFEKVLGAQNDYIGWVSFDIKENLGYLLEADGNLDGARKHFGDLAANFAGIDGHRARYQEARIAEKMDDKDGAATLLTEIVTDFKANEDLDRNHYVYVQTRERLLTLNPDADVPEPPRGRVDPAMLQRLMQAQQAQAGGSL